MDFETRVMELNKYVPILEGFIDKLSGDPTKASHVQSIRNVKCLITERLLTESNISKCEAVLKKLDQMHKKENEEQMLQERITKLIARYGPFLENCILKLEKSDTPKAQSHLRTMRTLQSLLSNRRLTHENIDICEISLQQLDEKVEKNTIDRIRIRIESDSKKEEAGTEKKEHSSSKKAKAIPLEDNVLFDRTSDTQRYDTSSLAFVKDPRTQNKWYIERSRVQNKTILLEVILPYKNSTLAHHEDRLALRYKTKKKPQDPIQENNVQSLPNLPTGKSSAFDNLSLTFMNATMSYSSVSTASMHHPVGNIPQMVPPPQPVNNQVYADIVQQLCGEFNALQQPAQQQILPSTDRFGNAPTSFNRNAWETNGQSNTIMQATTNPMIPYNTSVPASQNSISYGNTDPRLNRNRSQLYDPVAALENAPPVQSNYEQRESGNSRFDDPNPHQNDRDPRSKRRDSVSYNRRNSISGRRPRTPSPVARRDSYSSRDRSPNRYNKDKRSDYHSNKNKRSNYQRDNERHIERRRPRTPTKESVRDKERRRPRSPMRESEIDKDRRRPRSPTRKHELHSGRNKQSPVKRNEADRYRDASPEEMWDDLCKPTPNVQKSRRDSETLSQSSETLSQTSEKSSTLTISSRDKDDSSVDSRSTTSGSFKIPKMKSGETKSSSNSSNKDNSKSSPTTSQKASLKQKDFIAELTKLDKPEKMKSKNKNDSDVDEISLLEQLSKVYGADKLNKIKSILGAESEKKKNKVKEQQKSKKQMKRIRTISSDDESVDVPRQKIRPKIEPVDVEPETKSPIMKVQKKRTHDLKELGPQVKKIKKEPDDDEIVQKPEKSQAVAKISPNVKNKKKKSELDKLNEDIDNMFIRDGVLGATGRRNVTFKSPNKMNLEEEFYGVKVKKCFVRLTRCDTISQTNTKKTKRQSNETISKKKKEAEISLECNENITINESVKNTDPNYHLQANTSNTCLICNFTGINIVEHYMKKHPDKEVFISRFNPKAAKSVKDNPIAKNATICDGTVYNVNAKMKLRCGFCLQEMISTRKLWKMHLMQHTGEFHCNNCKVSDPYPTDSRKYRAEYPHKPSCKGTKKFTIDALIFHANGLDAFMCPDCNFVQLIEENIKQHITQEHTDASDMQPIRFLIIGFNTENSETQAKKPQKKDQQKLVIKNTIPNSSEHAYAQPIPKPIKTEPDTDRMPAAIPKPIIPVKQELVEVTTEPKSSFSISINHKNPLKVWVAKPALKTESAIKNMLKIDCLYSFYKCMHPQCGYYTAIKELMESHLHGHLVETVECCYCDITSNGISSYLQHMDEVHKSNVYQCAYCFYRSCAAFNVVTHENHYHRNVPNKILICPGRPSLLVNELDLIYDNRSKYVPALTCTVCGYKTYIQDAFKEHLEKHPVQTVKCQSCTSYEPKQHILKHLLTHRIGLYECVYCFYGTMSLESIRLHMSCVHPTKLLYVTARLKRNAQDQSLDDTKLESTVLAHVGQNVDKNIILSQEPIDTSTFVSDSLSPSKVISQSNDMSKMPKISSVVSFGEPVSSPKSLTVINPVNICGGAPQQPTKIISPNTKLILQGSSSYKPGTKVVLKTIGTPSSTPLNIKMADGKFIRLSGMTLTNSSSLNRNISTFSAKASEIAAVNSNKNIEQTPKVTPIPTTSTKILAKPTLTPPEFSNPIPDVMNLDTIPTGDSSTFPLIIPKRIGASTIEPIKEEINLGAILMDDDE